MAAFVLKGGMNVHSDCGAAMDVRAASQEERRPRDFFCCIATPMTSRERILAAARELVVARGFHQTAMAELAIAASVSVGQIYRLFASKAEIIIAIVNEDIEERIAIMTALNEQVRSGILEVEAAFVELALQVLTTTKEALGFEILAEAHRNPIVGESIGELCVGYRAIIRELAYAANPQLSSNQLDGAEELLLAILFGLGNRSLSRPSLDAHTTAHRTARMILQALRNVCPPGAP